MTARTIAILQSDKIAAETELAKLRRDNAKLRAALALVDDYFDNRADVVDGDYGCPAPNAEMSILMEIREAMGR